MTRFIRVFVAVIGRMLRCQQPTGPSRRAEETRDSPSLARLLILPRSTGLNLDPRNPCSPFSPGRTSRLYRFLASLAYGIVSFWSASLPLLLLLSAFRFPPQNLDHALYGFAWVASLCALLRPSLSL
ncbi:hypothetical protein N656DRAFT_576499 [Canariomyces notabilis]|uniref:Uncharacterized protein n=1 Tax=Canariomyces notabilis TaxID=2074819 RepID=A0AAN6TGU4_9PEZI|nr:hypothetical protein N656DRAFT_576499 [Canariomyces arenarius]